MQRAFSRKGWLLFAAMGAIWGVPYLMIKVAVKYMEPPVVVFGRAAIAAVVLVVLASRSGALRAAAVEWRTVALFAVVEMAIPWWLLTDAEKELPSGIAGLLIACVPLVGAVAAFTLGDRSALSPLRIIGIAFGLSGVVVLVWRDLGSDGPIPWLSVVQVLIVCVCYATAPFLISRRVPDVPSVGVIALCLSLVAVLYAPIAWLSRPDEVPPAHAIWAVVGLAVICTGIAFIVFFALIRSVGPDRAMLTTFINPAVAVSVGALLLDERITLATLVGFALVLTGCWFATRPHASSLPAPPPQPQPTTSTAA